MKGLFPPSSRLSFFEDLGPAGVVVEVAGDERDVDVAGLADGLAVVECFEDGELAGVLLHLAGERVEIAGALVAGERLPAREGLARGLHGCIHIGFRAGGDVGDLFAVGGIGGGEDVRRLGPLAVNVVAEGALVLGEPGVDLFGVFRGRAVLHAVELFDDAVCHISISSGFLRDAYAIG